MPERMAAGIHPAYRQRMRPKDVLDEKIDRCIEYLYREGPEVGIDAFRIWALRRLGRLIPFDAALWGIGSYAHKRFHSTSVIGLPDTFADTVERTQPINPAFDVLHEYPGVPIAVDELLGDDFESSELYDRLYQPCALQRILATAVFDRRSNLFALITLYRKEAKARFAERERYAVSRIMPHLVAAASHAYFRQLANPLRYQQQESRRALIDVFEAMHEVQPGFLDLVEEHFDGWQGPALPFSGPVGERPCSVADGLVAVSESCGDLRIVEIWRASEIDRLTPRELEVAEGVSAGMSYKQVARKLDIAAGTVATYVRRIYERLGVHNRGELIELMRRR